MSLKLEVKKLKFRRKQMQQKVSKAQSRVLNRGGFLVRKEARKSMRKGPKKGHGRFGGNTTISRGKNRGKIRFRKGRYSRPGTPPFYRSSPPNLRTIFYAFDPSHDSVLIGPVKLRSKTRQSRTVANIHEFGGRVARRDRLFGRRAFQYRKRSFMQPAGMKAIAGVRKELKGSVR